MLPAGRSNSPSEETDIQPPVQSPPAPQLNRQLDRRLWLAGAGSIAAGSVAAGLASMAGGSHAAESASAESSVPGRIKNGRVSQSVCHWCFNPMSLDVLAEAAAAMGLKSVEIVHPKDWGILKKNGLVCAMTPSHLFVNGLNRVENHPECLEMLRPAIEATGDAGFPNVITFSGMRNKLSDEEGIKNTVDGIKQVIGLAEKKKVNLCIEVLNSRVATEMKGHPDYQCDKVDWAAEVCRQVASPRMKILFDIYHVQIMEGDIITRIRQYKDFIGHYHTAGNPGRNDLDDTQEINYPPIMRAILETGYTGYVGQEFIPKGPDKLAALWQGVSLCDV